MFRKTLTAGLLGLLLQAPLHGETWQQALDGLIQQGQSIQTNSQSASWGQQLVRQDLELLLQALQQTGTGQGRAADIQRRQRSLQISLSGRGDQAMASWLQGVELFSQRLHDQERAFEGKLMGTRMQWADLPYTAVTDPKDIAGPGELLRTARSIRFDLQTGRNPLNWRGGFGFGWGIGVGNAGFNGNEFQDLVLAADRFERTCQSDYQDVRQTERSFRKLESAFQRLWPSARSQSFGLRNVERSIDQLNRFYQSLPPSPQPQ